MEAGHYPHLQRSLLTETNAYLLGPHSCDQRSGGLKPQRGGLFIVTDAPRSLFLFFGGAAFAKRTPSRFPASKHDLRTKTVQPPRRRKTKRITTICILL